tara:strand:- start:853 stop:1092 length:240 start_codon:yes stop_codon:yes gene_type:complete
MDRSLSNREATPLATESEVVHVVYVRVVNPHICEPAVPVNLTSGVLLRIALPYYSIHLFGAFVLEITFVLDSIGQHYFN